ncbi:hypothetical protein AB1Y20_021724 [Prymnesium parvum]|uniref:Carrier domain-containing protein n=1 Tax=Prymnesium parvum TaxID=97485 RepID=A0AB34JJJ0_PRYPA
MSSPIGLLPMLTDDEAFKLRYMFERSANLRGEHLAVIDDTVTLTYAQLNARGDALCDLVLTELDRVKFMLELIDAKMVLTDPVLMVDDEMSSTMTALHLTVLSIQDPRATNGTLSRVPRPVRKFDSVANVIFTSGSSGKPKGVMIQLIGVPGELLIGGAGVARGYIARDDLTAERFLPDPFLDYTSSEAKVGRRIYRTGDLVRWLPNGELEFLGRIDGQVKIRGHRIELGEIDAVLLQQRNVLEATTVVRGDSTSSKRLIAYVAPIAGETLSVLELRTALSRVLAEYMRPERLFFSSGHDVSLESYWARELAGELPVLAIPTDMPRPVAQTFEGRSCSLSIPVPLASSLREIARAEGVTMFTLLLTTWACVLHRYTGQEDLLIGTPMACRSKIELEGVIGYFVNPVCLRIRPSAGVAFTRLLQHTRQTVLGAMLHQDYPFSVLAERLLADAPRDLSRSPLFQSMFSLEQSMDARASSSSCGDLTSFAIGSEGAEVSLGTLKLRALALEQHISQFDLTLSCREVEGEMSSSLQYNAGLFLPSTAQRLLRHFLEMLRAIAADPKCSVGKLPMLNREEKREMLDWGRGRSDYAVPETLVHKLQAQLEATPDALALQAYGSEALSLTYSELHARANGIAREILRLVGPRRTNGATPVAAICTERSLHFVVALLAGLKAGCPYLPLDRTYPRDRLIHMLADSAACVMLTTSTCFAEMKSVCSDNVDILCVDQLHPDSDSTTTVVSLSSLKPDDVAYLVYTSGSTGKPKAIEVPHSSLANLVAWHANEYSVIASDRASHLIGHGFDPINLELWPFLAHGASVHVVPEARRADPTALLQFIREAKITICLLPTPLAELALHMRWPEGCEQFRVLYTGGEKLKAGATPAGAPHFRFDNHYGPAECTVMATVHTLRPKELHPPIGKPIGRALLYVVSPGSFELQPIGVAGELLIGGSLVAKGYVGRAKLTAEKFVPDAFANASGEVGRVYRTGDLVRWVPSGELEFLGRIDGQVKIRGHRIELGEIEAALLAVGFDAAAVIDVSVGDGDKKLAAYVVGSGPIEAGADNDNSSPTIKWRRTAATTRRLLAEHLAEYMLPSSYMHLESLPLTSNQKVDRSKLPKPTFDDLDIVDIEEILPSETPSTNTEELLRAEFSELLGVEVSRIGVRSSFFALGGHSIAAARLAARCAAVFHVELPLPMVFSHPRLGRIVGHSISGSCNTDDFLFRMLKGCVQLGSYPSFQWVERAAPVDFVSSAIVAISMTAHCTSHFAYHQVHSEAFKWTDLFKWTAALGYRLECVELDVWVSQLESERDSGESSNAMLPLLPLLKEVGLEADVPLFSCENTLAALANTNVRCPPMDAALWARFIGAMQKQGFLHLPS